MSDKTVYIYTDEAGNFDFSGKGSKYFIMTCVTMRRPFTHLRELLSLKYDCNADGYSHRLSSHYQRFHAAEELQYIRDKVFCIIRSRLDEMSIFAVIMSKDGLSDEEAAAPVLYQTGFTKLLEKVLEKETPGQVKELVIVTDSIPTKRKQGVIRGALKEHLKHWSSELGVSYQLYHHESSSDLNLQVVDYICWAIQRKWERKDERSYVYLQNAIELEVLLGGMNVAPEK